jgi:voltage-gated potassium channel Kch
MVWGARTRRGRTRGPVSGNVVAALGALFALAGRIFTIGFIVCGYGRLGRAVVERLEQEQVDLVVIDTDRVVVVGERDDLARFAALAQGKS